MASPFQSCNTILPRPWRCNLGWPPPVEYRPAPLFPYTGFFNDRQSRFYFRGLRRSGIYLDDIPVVTLWVENDWGSDDVWLP